MLISHELAKIPQTGNFEFVMTEDTEVHSPYKLIITINYAEQLPKADFTTSDPYVAIIVNNRYCDRTKVIYRNHKLPIWNETFNIKLLHRNSLLLLKIWDDDRGKNDDLMGTVEIDLSTIELEKEIQNKYSIQSAGNFNTKLSKITFTLKIIMNSSVIKIIHDNKRISNSITDNITTMIETINSNNIILSESIINALTRFIDNDRIDYFYYELIKDLLFDVNTLYNNTTDTTATTAAIYDTFLFERTELKLVNSRRIILETGQVLKHPPIEANTVQINLNSNETLFVTIKYNNRLALWNGVKWLRLLYDYWKNKINKNNLPLWASNGIYCPNNIKLILSDGRIYNNNKIQFNIYKQFEILIDNDEVIPIHTMNDVVISVDSVLPQAYVMSLDIINYSYNGNYTTEQQVLLQQEKSIDISNKSNDDHYDPGDHIGTGRLIRKFRERKHGVFTTVGKGIKGTVGGAIKGITAVGTGAVNVASTAGHAAVNTVVTVGDTVEAIASGTVDSVVGVARGDFAAPVRKIVTGVQAAPNQFFGSKATYLMLKCNNVSQRIDHNSSSLFYFDWSGSKSIKKESFLKPTKIQDITIDIDDTTDNNNNIDHNKYQLFPDFDYKKTNIMLLLCHGTENLETVVGYHRLSASNLLKKVNKVNEMTLNNKLGYCITLHSINNINLFNNNISNINQLLSTIGRGNIHVKFKLVDKNGKSNNNIRHGDGIRSPSVVPSGDLISFNDYNIIFEAKDGIEYAEFIRIEIILEDFTSNITLGAVFVPLYYFQLKHTKYIFPIINYRNTIIKPISDTIKYPYGEIEITIHRIEELNDSKATVAIRPTINEVNIFNTKWYAEAMLAGSVNYNNDKNSIEEYCLYPALRGLELCSVCNDTNSTSDKASFSYQKGTTTTTINNSISNDNNNTVPSWRRIAANKCAVLSVCKEKSSLDSPVVIPWDQVMTASIVSESLLSIYVKINRYFKEENGVTSFKPADVEIFVSNCPASQLKSLIEERIWFDQIKDNIRQLIQSGSCTGKALKPQVSTATMGSIDEDVPETEELSLGSEIVADLDDNSIAIETRIQELDEIYNKNEDNAILLEKSILVRRDCRLRLYTAALLGVGLTGNHDFSEEVVKHIMLKDFKRAMNISQDTDVSTANNRIEFFLDIAEKRIRDAVLCGWKYRGTLNEKGRLESTIEIFANGYFIEIVGLLGSFFEEQGQQDMKGLESKVDLLNTYVKHNDRLSNIIDNALRPYALIASPPAKLSLFLDFNILASWYTTNLVLEMRSRVNDVLNVWKDIKKDVTGLSSLYNYPLPWIPQRLEIDNGHFYSSIPEDLVEVLFTYLQHAILKKNSISPSFRQYIGRMESEVCLSYTTAMLYLCEQYDISLRSQDWAGAQEEEQLIEHSTWLCSVADDCYRIVGKNLHKAVRLNRSQHHKSLDSEDFEISKLQKEKEQDITQRAESAFSALTDRAIDHVSSIVFTYSFHDRMDLLTSSLPQLWRTSQCENIDTGDKQSLQIIPALIEDVSFYVSEKYSFLEKPLYKKLLLNAADKIIIIYLSLLQLASNQGFVLSQLEINQVAKDVASLQMLFLDKTIVENFTNDEKIMIRDEICDKFSILDLCVQLLGLDVTEEHTAVETLDKVVNLAKTFPLEAYALAELSEALFGLQGLRLKGTTVSGKEQERRRSSTASLSSVSSVSNHKSKHRKSIFGRIFHSKKNAPSVVTEETLNNQDMLDEDTALQAEFAQIKRKVYEECVQVMMDSIREQYRKTDEDKKANSGKRFSSSHESILSLSPLRRVFGQQEAFGTAEKFTLEELLLAPMVTHGNGMTRRHGKHQTNIDMHNEHSGGVSSTLARTLKGLFISSKKDKEQYKNIEFMKKMKSVDEALAEGIDTSLLVANHNLSCNNSSAASTNISRFSLRESSKANQMYLVLYGLKAMHLFYLDVFSTPHAYLHIRLGNSFACDSDVIEMDSDNYAISWSNLSEDTTLDHNSDVLDKGAVFIPITNDIAAAASSPHSDNNDRQVSSVGSSLANLTITLCYQGFLRDHVIGSVTIPFAPYAPPTYTNKQITITDYSHSTQAKHASIKATEEGRSLPTIQFSLMPRSGLY